MNTQKKTLLIALLLGGALLLGIAQSISANASEPYQIPPSPTPEALGNGWYRFTDEEAGYSFDYPADALSFSPGRDKGEKYNHLYVQFSTEYGQGQGMVLYVESNSENLLIEDFLIQEFHGKWSEQVPPQNLSKAELGEHLTLGGKNAIKTTIREYVELDTSPFFVFIENGNKIIALGPMVNVMNGGEVTPEAESLFMQILGTFRFNP